MSEDSANREDVLKLIVSQLQFYDQSGLARVVAQATGLDYEHDPSDQLAQTIAQAAGGAHVKSEAPEAPTAPAPSSSERPASETVDVEEKEARPVQDHTLAYTVQHKGPINCAVFSHDGQYIATGANDSSVKVMETKLMSKSTGNRSGDGDEAVIKALFDHAGPVRDVAFHGSNLILASCSSDRHIRFYDISRNAAKRSFRYIQDPYPIRSIAFHPAGNHLIAGPSQHSALRLYDVHTLKCFAAPDSGSSSFGSTAESAGFNCVRASPDGRMYASCGDDGYIRIWDAINGQCVNSWRDVHNKEPVLAVQWSKQSKQLLSTGANGQAKVWDVAGGRSVQTFSIQSKLPISATFTFNEQHVVLMDDVNMVFCDAASGEQVRAITTPHGPPVGITASPVQASLLTFGEDGKAQHWSA
ncbi:hypothetical protein RI367_003367 [Sorochytrium milnesiophthora]